MDRFELIKRNTEEILGEEDLVQLLKNKEKLKHYIGFEISNKPHIGHGLVCMAKVKDLMDAGVDCSIFLADWHSWINDKLGGDLKVIKGIGAAYFKECILAGFKCVGGDTKKLKFLLGSDLYHNNDLYWSTLIDISKNTSLARILRSITIMGRAEGDSVDFAKLIYPPMQVADIFIQGINLPHAGMDQRKAQVIARDVALKLNFSPLLNKKKEKIKPIAIHGHLILGLQKPTTWPISKENLQEFRAQMKMSKSIPSSAVYMDDSEEQIKDKINKAFCLEKEISYNPILDWCKYIIFAIGTSPKLEIKRLDKFGGNITYKDYATLEKDFAEGKLHPSDLKNAVAQKLIKILEPARDHLNSPKIKKLKEEMDKLIITR
ncbi:MAG: tyrosine--tRNA ligase [Candidatus Nanoarchaeia archaeon]|nr:tyrosine--tRNA ligase [Candidatus Nanoarchaeia archaeon]MDD5587840.1 tyrosine--tRNA ligase [Candidatus Nanoarchaeia archaeon]